MGCSAPQQTPFFKNPEYFLGGGGNECRGTDIRTENELEGVGRNLQEVVGAVDGYGALRGPVGGTGAHGAVRCCNPCLT